MPVDGYCWYNYHLTHTVPTGKLTNQSKALALITHTTQAYHFQFSENFLPNYNNFICIDVTNHHHRTFNLKKNISIMGFNRRKLHPQIDVFGSAFQTYLK